MSKLLAVTEPYRAIFEFINYKLLYVKPPKASSAKNIILLPGFMSHDNHLKLLKEHLEARGHNAKTWGYGTNTGFSEAMLDMLVDEIVEPTILIGHSLGGVYAREIAKCNHNIEQVICLGSPVLQVENNVAPAVKKAYLLINPIVPSNIIELEEPPAVDTTMIYTVADGIVDWRSCINPSTNNIEVSGSHCGLIFNREVMNVLDSLLT